MDFLTAIDIPQPLKAVAAQIRARSGIELAINQSTPDLKERFPELEKIHLLEIDPDERRICIWYPGDAPSPPDLCHELIHARRKILESVPRISPLPEARYPALISELENDFEHLFVVPEELFYFPARIAKWEKLYSILVPLSGTNVLNLFRQWVFIHVAMPESAEIMDLCRSALQDLNLLDDAEMFRREIEAALPRKERVLNVVSNWFPDVGRDSRLERYVAADGVLKIVSE